MAFGAEDFLAKNLGEDFLESLAKVELWKPGTRTVVDHEEIRTALKIVPRTIMALLIRELAPMKVGEHKDVPLHLGLETQNAVLKVDKHERDVYSGQIDQDNKMAVDFKFRPLPGVGLVIMSCFELYDAEELKHERHPDLAEDAEGKIQRMIEERIFMHDLVHRVIENKLSQRDAMHQAMLNKLSESLRLTESELMRVYDEKAKLEKQNHNISQIAKMAREEPQAKKDDYFQGMANGLAVADACANNVEPKFVEKKKGSPLKGFLDNRSKKKEFQIVMAKGETVDCPDCHKNIFDGKLFSGCICLGDDRDKKVYIKKSETGIVVRFGRGWEEENIEMLLDVLRKKHG